MFKHFISATQFTSTEMLHEFFIRVKKFETPWMFGMDPFHMARGQVMASWYAEESTRTRVSFETAMLRLGGAVTSTSNAGQTSSVAKGESWVDTIKTLSELVDIIVARTPQEGDAENAAAVAKVPFINAGDGKGEHPTQALLDVYTLWKKFGDLSDITVALVGDLKYSRTVHSLLKLLGLYNNITYHLVAPDRLMIDPREYIKKPNVHYRTHKSLDELVEVGPTVVYMTRNQLERREDTAFTHYFPKYHYMTLKHAERLPESSVILHPLPRNHEIHPEVDQNHRALYWQQVKNGLYIRMALIDMLLRENGK